MLKKISVLATALLLLNTPTVVAQTKPYSLQEVYRHLAPENIAFTIQSERT